MYATTDNALKYRIIALLENQGFNDPYMITEMLGRFDGEVSLKMKEDPLLSLEDALDWTMKVAHKDFILPGNYPVAASSGKLVQKKYKALYISELKKMVTSPVYLMAAFIASLISFKGYYWSNTNFRIWDINGMVVLLFFAWLLISIVLFSKFSIRNK